MALQHQSHRRTRTISLANSFNVTDATLFGNGCKSTELSRKYSTLRRIVIPAAILHPTHLKSPDRTKDSSRRIGSPGDCQNSNPDISGRQNIFRQQTRNGQNTPGIHCLENVRRQSVSFLTSGSSLRFRSLKLLAAKIPGPGHTPVTFEAESWTPYIQQPQND